MEKLCPKCGLNKPSDLFIRNHSWCRPCRNDYARKWHAEHRGYQKRINEAHADRVHRFSSPVRRLFYQLAMAIWQANAGTRIVRKTAQYHRAMADPEYREARRRKTRAWAAAHPEANTRKRERAKIRGEGVGDLVYFVRASTGGPIKIGYTSRNPENRLQGLNVGHWQAFEIIGIIFGGRREESDLHFRFQHLAIRGEWFWDEPELLNFIADNAIPWSVTSNAQEAERSSESETAQAAIG